ERLAKDLNIPSGFEELGAKHEDIQTLAENAMKDVTAATNPRKPRLQEVMEIIRQAM
ncbi:MAG TPA: iron-containing alcohol dehydrogenase, partial [Metalysinibacillus sp.]